MAATPEKKIKQRVTKLLDQLGAYYFFPTTGGYGRSGVPDIIACWRGRFIAIECKANGGTVTALQARELNRIDACEGVAVVVDETNIDALHTILWSAIDR